jgi:hypothetical protein
MAITGAHVLLYSAEADALRGVLTDALGFRAVDAGEGWLIFALPPAELAVHPADRAQHELSFMCDDIEATMSGLRAKGVEFKDGPQDRGWGIAATMLLPGGAEVLLYEPRHPTAV